jgi:hypothetical protein
MRKKKRKASTKCRTGAKEKNSAGWMHDRRGGKVIPRYLFIGSVRGDASEPFFLHYFLKSQRHWVKARRGEGKKKDVSIRYFQFD